MICQVPLATAEDVDAAVKAARAAFGGWGDTSGAERARYLRDIAQGIENRKEELAVIEVSLVPRPEADDCSPLTAIAVARLREAAA